MRQIPFNEYGPNVNRILAALPRDEYERILPKLEEVPLTLDAKLLEFGKRIHYVYFPNSGMISILAAVEDDLTLISCLVGNEGIHGVPVFLGSKISSMRAVVQGDGTAMRMKTADFEAECKLGGALPKILMRFVLAVMIQILQSTVCYRYHSKEKRLARWLLMSSDRMGSDEFKMTQDYMANMVGVRRESVSAAAGSLQKKNLICYSRGALKIIDRPGLESVACMCYSIIRTAEKRIFG